MGIRTCLLTLYGSSCIVRRSSFENSYYFTCSSRVISSTIIKAGIRQGSILEGVFVVSFAYSLCDTRTGEFVTYSKLEESMLVADHQRWSAFCKLEIFNSAEIHLTDKKERCIFIAPARPWQWFDPARMGLGFLLFYMR